ncbi:MAG: hypothetical protein R3Y58_12530 [Eubacteriales bacterium]
MEMRNRKTFDKIIPMVQRIEEENASSNVEEMQSVMLFFSYDVVNSTTYKANNKGRWSVAVGQILRHIISTFANSPVGGYRFWKTLGDEIIFMKEVHRVSDIFLSVEEIYEQLTILNSEIDKGMLCDKKASELLAIKGTAWLAEITTTDPEIDDIFVEYQINDNRKQTEYIGPNIDIGFRLADYSMHNRLVISFNLAYILLDYQRVHQSDVNSVVYITSKILKGVWNGEPHPIFMYVGENRAEFEESISRHQKSGMKVLADYLEDTEARNWEPTADYTYYEEKIVAETCKRMQLDSGIERLFTILKTKKINPYHKVREFTRVHYTALCYSKVKDQLQFMIVKDANTGLWGFGGDCMYHNFQYMWNIKKYYKENYGVTIMLDNDVRYQSPTPYILTTYTYLEYETELRNGTVFLGEILNPEKQMLGDASAELNGSPNQNGKKQIMFIEASEIAGFAEPCIEGFHDILKQAIEHLVS